MNRTETDTAWAKQALRDVTLRATAARVAVLKLLASKGVPMSHSEVVVSLEGGRGDGGARGSRGAGPARG